MPQMNRIRVNNVKYNFGTQCYDDFIMRLNGKNTIYDLANGGGKSVLMLLLLQNLIPNCTLDEKQPIEKLFRTSGGSKTIHSLIEWNLDEQDIKEDYRYMLTGFCARKAKDAAEDEAAKEDTAAIEYFNYCMFYRTYHENDLVNLPLVKDGERITYNGLKNYLKELSHQALDLKIYIFDRKGEYLQFISQYGLYESAWEMIRGINKTEGHVRTYFETNYRTTRKVVEDLLIEGIIEKSFRDKTDQEDMNEAMAKTLLDMKDKLVELAEKKGEMNRFEHQKELLQVLAGRVGACRDLYEEKEDLTAELLSAKNMLLSRAEQKEEELRKKKQMIEQKGEECARINQVVACLKVQQEEEALLSLKKEAEEAKLSEANARIVLKEQEEICRSRENANDYLDYCEVRQKMEQAQAVIEKSRQDSSGYLDRLYDLAAIKKQYYEECTAKQEQLLLEAEKTEHEIKVALKADMGKKGELTCEHAVAGANKKRLFIEAKTKETTAMELKKQTNLLLLEDAKKAVREKEKEIVGYRTEQEEAEGQLAEAEAKLAAMHMREKELDFIKKEQEEKQQEQSRIRQEINEGLSRMQALAQTYQIEWEEQQPKQEQRQQLLEHARRRWADCTRYVATKKQQMEQWQEEQAQKKQGHFLADEVHLKTITSYLTDRHELEVVPAEEVLLTLSKEEQEEVIERLPFAPYGLVLKGATKELIRQLQADQTLAYLCRRHLVPLFSEELFETLEWGETAPFVILSGDGRGYYDQTVLSEYEKRTEQALLEAEQEVAQAEESERLLEEDYLFLLKQNQQYEQLEEKEPQTDGGSGCEKEQEELFAAMKKQEEEIEELKKQRETLQERMENAQQECRQLTEIRTCYQEFSEYKKQALSEQEREETLARELTALTRQMEQKNAQLKQAREQAATLKERRDEQKEQWDTYYAPYDKGRPVLDLGYTEEQVDIEFRSRKTIVEQGAGSVSDKQDLVDTLKRNLEQLLRSMKRRNADLSELEEKKEQGLIHRTGEKELSSLYKECSRYEQRYENCQQQAQLRAQEVSKVEGRIEHGLKELTEQGIRYERMEMEAEQLDRAIEEQRLLLSELMTTRESFTKEFVEEQKQYARQQDFLKDVNRLITLYHLEDREGSSLPDLSEYTLGQLKSCQERFGEVIKKEQKARLDLEQYKQQTAETLKELKAYELSEVIRKDITMPETKEELEQLQDSLKDMMEFITLEQERVTQGVKDMQLIKEGFENQCLRRCEDVKTELMRLPKLSDITLDGEVIQMIDLSIPYEPQERLTGKMAEYVDAIVKGIDQFSTLEERMKYIRKQLSLKQLFSVVVTDMNKIRLKLYKRERIKEQSRYLRYEEAVGSTGQSQGIYIQFLIAIINYIANIYAVNSDNNKLGKVIFIDNPFGAAKDIYIWEPIFEMLKTNNVQLIVPARGATPAITGRFDVNYVLGQKLINGRQQTVVVDYRSQVEKTEMEYKRIEFTQNSFDFI